MSASGGRRVDRPYRKASEYLATKQPVRDGPRTINALERENAELREKLTTSVRKMETMEVEYEQSREYFSNQLDITNDKLDRTAQALKVMQQSYSELQSINYELEQRILKVSELEQDRSALTSDVHELTNKLTEARTSLQKTQKENERLRKDCNLAVSLLECNAGNFKQQSAKELPQDLQNRVEEYQMDLSQYNEYINPYADESDSEEDTRQYRQTGDSVPSELLANVLKKSESVHMNIEDIDYIRDPDLNSTYKGQIAERKLVKHDYSSTVPRTSNPNFTHLPKSSSMGGSSGGQSSSPWELARTATSSGSSSPWEMSTNPPTQNEYDMDDYSSASAYGAYPVSYRNPRQKKKSTPSRNIVPQGIPEKRSAYSKSRMTSSYNAVTSPKSPSVQKGTGDNKDVYISQNFAQQAEKEQERKSSNNSSKKSTPAKVPTDSEKGTSAEKSSLLDQGHSEDDEDEVMTIEMGSKGPTIWNTKRRNYRTGEFEDRGLLQDSDPEVDERELDKEYDNARESDDQLRESDEQVRESSIHNEAPEKKIPEFDLLNLDDDIKIATNPLHHIMMQQGIDNVMMPASLPDLPNEVKYDGELILCGGVPAPPPPDMFGGGLPTDLTSVPNLMNEATPLQRPLISSQAHTVFSDAEPSSIASQVSSTNSLDDLKTIVRKEFESVQSPVKKPAPRMVPDQNLTKEAASSLTDTQNFLTDQPKGVEDSSRHSDVGDAAQRSPKKDTLPDSNPVGATIEDDVIQQEDRQNVKEKCKTGPGNDKAKGIRSPTHDGDQESQKEDAEATETFPHGDSQESNATDSFDETNNKNSTDVKEVIHAEVTDDGSEEPEFEFRRPVELSDDSIDRPLHERHQIMSKNIVDQTHGSEHPIIMEGSHHDQELLSQVSVSSSPTQSNDEGKDGPAQASGVDEHLDTEPPLEVVELQEEPRGGVNYGRRRRNSFDQAREYGNVMVD